MTTSEKRSTVTAPWSLTLGDPDARGDTTKEAQHIDTYDGVSPPDLRAMPMSFVDSLDPTATPQVLQNTHYAPLPLTTVRIVPTADAASPEDCYSPFPLG